MENSCGGCTACCKTHGVFAILKLGGTWCPHCRIGQGCGIYSNRPPECVTFKCSWLLGLSGSILCRPDKTGIVPDYIQIPHIGFVLRLFEAQEGALESEFTKKWTQRNLLRGNCVFHIPLSGDDYLYMPEDMEIPHIHFTQDMSDKEVVFVPFVKRRFQT